MGLKRRERWKDVESASALPVWPENGVSGSVERGRWKNAESASALPVWPENGVLWEASVGKSGTTPRAQARFPCGPKNGVLWEASVGNAGRTPRAQARFPCGPKNGVCDIQKSPYTERTQNFGPPRKALALYKILTDFGRSRKRIVIFFVIFERRK